MPLRGWTVDFTFDAEQLALQDVARRAMAEFRNAHPRGRHGTVVYDPGPLGLPATAGRDVLQAYRERFLTPG